MTYELAVLKLGQADVPGPQVYWMSHWGEWETLNFYMVVIRRPGLTAIINTGPSEDLTILNRAWHAFAGERCQMLRREGERPLEALAKIGVTAEEVTHILLTPLQSYTTANIPLFPNATICCSKRGWIEDVVARPSQVHGSRQLCVPDTVLQYLLFEASDRVRLLEDEEEICPGIRAWWAGGHHRSSMVYAVDMAGGVAMVADCAFKYGNMEGHPLGIAESLAECAKAYSRIRAGAAHFIPLYDPEVLRRYPNGEVR